MRRHSTGRRVACRQRTRRRSRQRSLQPYGGSPMSSMPAPEATKLSGQRPAPCSKRRSRWSRRPGCTPTAMRSSGLLSSSSLRPRSTSWWRGARATATWPRPWSRWRAAAVARCWISCSWPTSIRAPRWRGRKESSCESKRRRPAAASPPFASAVIGQVSDPDFRATRGLRLRPRDPAHPLPAQRPEMLADVLLPAAVRERIQRLNPECLILVPDGALHKLPFEALLLRAGERPAYVLDELPPLVYAPSVAILALLAERPAAAPAGLQSLLSVADPAYIQAAKGAVQGAPLPGQPASLTPAAVLGQLPRLPYTAKESERISGFFQSEKGNMPEGRRGHGEGARGGPAGTARCPYRGPRPRRQSPRQPVRRPVAGAATGAEDGGTGSGGRWLPGVGRDLQATPVGVRVGGAECLRHELWPPTAVGGRCHAGRRFSGGRRSACGSEPLERR